MHLERVLVVGAGVSLAGAAMGAITGEIVTVVVLFGIGGLRAIRETMTYGLGPILGAVGFGVAGARLAWSLRRKEPFKRVV
jgi:hypothetical protein